MLLKKAPLALLWLTRCLKGGPGKFMIPGIVKISVKDVEAKKARTGLHPLTKEQIIFKAKPAARRVKATALKFLKTMVI